MLFNGFQGLFVRDSEMPESFTDAEKQLLHEYCSNLDKNVFVLKNLPEAVKGALFSRYSRSAKGLRRLLLDEFISNPELGFSELVAKSKESHAEGVINKQKADDFFVRILDGYGDDSVGELGGCHIALENISNVATKIIEDARLGGSPLEKSTRYVFFDQKADGKYLFYEEPTIMASEFRKEYLELMNFLFDTYTELVQPLKAFMEKRFAIEEFSFMVDLKTRREEKFSNITDPEVQKRSRGAYNASIRAKVCDVLRGLLPASTLTNMGLYGNGRFFEYLLRKLYSNPLSEMRVLGKEMHQELDTQISSFVRRAKMDDYLAQTPKVVEMRVKQFLPGHSVDSKKPVALVDFEANAEDKIVSYCLFSQSEHSFSEIQSMVQQMSPAQKKEILSAYVGNRRSRRDKPGRAFENTYYTFEILADFGIYRDLQRHRVLTQERQLLSTLHGFDLPVEISEAGFEKKFSECMKRADALYRKIAEKMPLEAQYCVPMAYNIRWYMTLNLREAFHLIELRSTKQGHESYRRIVQLMFKEIKRVHPLFASFMNFVDLNKYSLSRLDAEMKQEHKRAEWKK